MLYTKEGFPEVHENVLCKVLRISGGNTVFVKLEEYDKEGVLTISEIAPGRIRNLRDHVVEDKEIICKVIRVNPNSGHIDVSLRRVNPQARKEKFEEIKREEFSEKVYVEVARRLNITKENLFERTYEAVFGSYSSIFESLYDIMQNHEKIALFTKLSKDEQKVFLDVINDKIKPEEVTLKKEFILNSTQSGGVEVIKKTISECLDALKHKKLSVTYLAAGNFLISVTSSDIKSAVKLHKTFQELMEQSCKKNKLNLEFKEKD